MPRIWLIPLILMTVTTNFVWAESTLKSPNVSGDALFLYRDSNFGRQNNSAARNGIDIQEAELAFYADVDPYSRLNMLFSASPTYDPTTGKQTWSFDPEELFVESDHIPQVTLKLGKFKAAFGKHNILHTHAFPFVDAPLINADLLGDEGLNDAGISAAGLLPVPWFSEITAQYLRGDGDNAEFNSPTPGDGVGVGHWKNLWDLSDDMTLEAGASYARGNNNVGGVTTLAGGDLTLKWRPAVGGKYHSGILAAEFIDRTLEQKDTTQEHGYGISGWTQYQFAQRWSAKVRYETLQATGGDTTVNSDALLSGLTTRGTAQVQFDATEFSFFRLEYSTSHGPVQANGLTDEHKIYLQANFTIGSHPAHSY